jgi:diaminohydroxyphosphoribosylaminopyrimidine deaminase/5-amino-6-(5-phosphoribosylamino)uracil reductase
VGRQPLRAVMGLRNIDPASRVLDDTAETIHLRTRDPHAALTTLFEAGRRHVLLEGGATLAAAFLRAGLVDETVTYVAPVLLGAGRAPVGDLGIGTIADAFEVAEITTIEGDREEQPNVRMTLRPSRP